MKKQPDLRRRMLHAFVVQSAVIAIAAVVGLVSVHQLLGRVLITHALEEESEHYWALLEADRNAPLANSLNLRAYVLPRDIDLIPIDPSTLKHGHQTLEDEEFNAVFVDSRGNRRLVLMFHRAGVEGLIALYGIAPLAAVLIALYIVSWLTYRYVNSALSPTVFLARAVSRLDPTEPDANTVAPEALPANADADVLALSNALQSYIERSNRSLERERNFSREASHELRTPITVIGMALSVLAEEELSRRAQSAADRIARANADMSELTTALLTLARETEQPEAREDPLPLIQEQTVHYELMAREKGLKLATVIEEEPQFSVPRHVLTIVLGNLLRNAIDYTDSGEVTLLVRKNEIAVRDTGPGLTDEQIEKITEPWVSLAGQRRSGVGIGLSIVKRLCDLCSWQLQMRSTVGHGSEFALLIDA
ncbi:MAG: HAMP domain-containing sensor histidine kinase [Pseudomonadota bacterium]